MWRINNFETSFLIPWSNILEILLGVEVYDPWKFTIVEINDLWKLSHDRKVHVKNFQDIFRSVYEYHSGSQIMWRLSRLIFWSKNQTSFRKTWSRSDRHGHDRDQIELTYPFHPTHSPLN